jgi:16S rRNA processing protein RimM
LLVIVGRIGRAHGIRGEVGVEVRTDEPERRFATGERLFTETEPVRTLTVTQTRWHSGRLLVKFAEVPDRTAAESLGNVVVQAEVPADERPDDPEEFYDRDLIGLAVRTPDGAAVGEVASVVHLPAQDLLEVRRGDGRTVLVPLVAELVPAIELGPDGHVVVDDRPGLLDPDAAVQPEADAAVQPEADAAVPPDTGAAAVRTDPDVAAAETDPDVAVRTDVDSR